MIVDRNLISSPSLSLSLNTKTLLGFGAWVNIPDALGHTPLHYAILGNHPEIAARLLAYKAEPNCIDDQEKTLLHHTVSSGNEVLTALLVDHGAKLNAENTVGNTPLHIAATKGARDCARWLLLRGCDRERVNKAAKTAAQLAVLSGNIDISNLIAKFGCEGYGEFDLVGLILDFELLMFSFLCAPLFNVTLDPCAKCVSINDQSPSHHISHQWKNLFLA